MMTPRPLPFYFLTTSRPEDYTTARVEERMRRLKDDGFGGLVLMNTAGFDMEEYLTPWWFEMTERFILAAKKYNLEFWFMDGWRCPPGDVGNKIEKINPNLKQQRLAKDCDGVKVVEVPWGFPAFEEPESSKLFIQLVYEEYKKHLGQYFGNGLTGIFSDTDCRRIDAFVLTKFEGDYYPWSKNFAKVFREEFGYDLMPYLTDIVNNRTTPQVYDYYRCCELLYLQWYRNNYRWCQQNGLKYTFHTSDTGPLPRSFCRRSSVFSEGNPLNFFRYSSYPGTDHEALALDGGTHFDSRMVYLRTSRGEEQGPVRTPSFNSTKYDLRAKYAGSAAYLYGKEGAMCEMFAFTNWGVTPGELRQIAAWQLLQGITFFVPHAIHNSMFGPSKYGAPPEQHYATGGAIRDINDFIGKYVTIVQKGDYAPRVKVVDPSEAVRAGLPSTETFFQFCDNLHHAGISYVIVPDGTPGAINANTTLPPLPERDFTFTGGDLMAMRRVLADGTHYLLVCNLWSDDELTGTLEFEGRKYELALASGEMAVIGGPDEEYRKPDRPERQCRELPFPAPVTYAEENMIPFHYNTTFTIAEDLEKPLRLQVHSHWTTSPVRYDGQLLTNGKPCRVFDDDYLEYEVPATAGTHFFELEIWQDRPANLGTPHSNCGNSILNRKVEYRFYDPVILRGEFHAELEIVKPFDHQVFCYYNMQLWVPEKCDITLSRPRAALNAGSWTRQGRPFYSGTATYRFDLEELAKTKPFPEGPATLRLPKLAVKADVVLDGQPLGHISLPPFTMPLGDLTGHKILEITVTNTLANLLEEYCAPSGLVGGAILEW